MCTEGGDDERGAPAGHDSQGPTASSVPKRQKKKKKKEKKKKKKKKKKKTTTTTTTTTTKTTKTKKTKKTNKTKKKPKKTAAESRLLRPRSRLPRHPRRRLRLGLFEGLTQKPDDCRRFKDMIRETVPQVREEGPGPLRTPTPTPLDANGVTTKNKFLLQAQVHEHCRWSEAAHHGHTTPLPAEGQR